MQMIEYFTELLRYVPKLVSKWANTACSTISDVTKKVIDVSQNLIKTIAKLSKESVEFIQSLLKQAVDMYGDVTEALSKLVDDVFEPAVRKLLKLPVDLARKISSLTKNAIPLIVNGVKLLADRAFSNVLNNCQETTSVVFTIAQYGRTACEFLGLLTGGDTIDIIILGLKTYLGETKPGFGRFFNKCSVITLLIEKFFNTTVGSILPGFLKTCQAEVIQSGLNWFSNQKICKTRPRNRVHMRTALCVLQSMGSLTLLPAFQLQYGAFGIINTLASIPWIPDPLKWVVDGFFNLTKSLPSITFGWQDISIKSLLNSATGLLATALELVGFVAFSSVKGLQINFSGKFGDALKPPPLPPAMTIQITMIKLFSYLMQKLVPLLLEMFKNLSSRVVALVNKWNICTPRFCINLLFVKVCAPRICVGDVVGGLSTIVELIMDLVIQGISPLFKATDMMTRLIGMGDSSDFDGLDSKLEEAFGSLTGKLPFYVRFG
jgi:phage-related protein